MDHIYYYNSFREGKIQKDRFYLISIVDKEINYKSLLKQIPWLRMNNRITIKNTIVRAFEITDASWKENKFVENLLRKCDISA